MSTPERSIQLARLWSTLADIRQQINNTVLPLATHLNVDDPVLVMTAEQFAGAIDEHFEMFRLQATERTTPANIKFDNPER